MRSCGRFAIDVARTQRAMRVICDHMRKGSTAIEADRAAGITSRTRERWLKRADGPFASFAREYHEAQAAARSDRVRDALRHAA